MIVHIATIPVMQYPEICPGCNEYYDAVGQMLEAAPGKLIRFCPRCEFDNETEDRDDYREKR